jgi:5-methylcytosine-specific restriction endonuclease McrA
MAKKVKSGIDSDRLDKVVASANRSASEREKGYREKALKMYPWVCGRCGREFTRANVQELTVHHRDHNHDNNPLDGSNWELLCIYCHDNEHSRYLDASGDKDDSSSTVSTHRPFANLKQLLDKDGETR